MVLCRLLYWFFALRHCTSTPNAGDLFSSVQRLLAISSSNATHCIVPPCLQPVLPGLAAPLPRHQPCKSLQERQKQLLLPLAPRVSFGQLLPTLSLGLLTCKILLCKASAALQREAPCKSQVLSCPGLPACTPGGKMGDGQPAFENPPKMSP